MAAPPSRALIWAWSLRHTQGATARKAVHWRARSSGTSGRAGKLIEIGNGSWCHKAALVVDSRLARRSVLAWDARSMLDVCSFQAAQRALLGLGVTMGPTSFETAGNTSLDKLRGQVQAQ